MNNDEAMRNRRIEELIRQTGEFPPSPETRERVMARCRAERADRDARIPWTLWPRLRLRTELQGVGRAGRTPRISWVWRRRLAGLAALAALLLFEARVESDHAARVAAILGPGPAGATTVPSPVDVSAFRSQRAVLLAMLRSPDSP